MVAIHGPRLALNKQVISGTIRGEKCGLVASAGFFLRRRQHLEGRIVGVPAAHDQRQNQMRQRGGLASIDDDERCALDAVL